MPVFVCPITHTIWGTPEVPAQLSSVAMQSIDNEIRSSEKSLGDSKTRAARIANSGSQNERKKICKKLDQLVVLVRAKHEKSRDIRDLEKAIELASETLNYTSAGEPEQVARQQTVASLLSTRFVLTRSINDLEGSIFHYAAFLDPNFPPSPNRDVPHKRSGSSTGAENGYQTLMYDYSQRLAERYELRRDPTDLLKAEQMCRQSLEMRGLDGTALAERQSHLAYLLHCKTQNGARRNPPEVNPPDMLTCIGLAKQALARLPPEDPRRRMYRLRLATYLNMSFRYLQNSAHLDEAIAIFDEEFPEFADTDVGSIPPTPALSRATTASSGTSLSPKSENEVPVPSPEDSSKPYHLRALANNLVTRYNINPVNHKLDLERAISCYRRALLYLLSLHPPDGDTHASEHPLWQDLACGLLDCNDKSGKKRVNIVIAGGGPVGQTCALAMGLQSVERSLVTGGPGVQVTLYESRLMDDGNGGVRWRGAEDNPPNTRRQQVITLQDAVIGNYDRSGVPWSKIVWNDQLNPDGGERVWPTSRQVPIRQVEDTITAYVQSDRFLKMCVTYKAQPMDEQVFDNIRPYCDLFIGADGAGAKSFSINHPEFRFSRNTYFEEQMDRALGVFVDIPGPHRQQAKNVFLTIAQTIYLLNSNYGTLGYLNIRLPSAYMSAMSDNETLESLAHSDDILKRRIAFVIRGGLAMFDLPETYVKAINRIELPMSNSTRYLATAQRNPNANPREQPGRNATFPVVLAGDAAIKFNFWPGRGANSGLIGAFGLTTTLFDLLPTVRPGTSIPVERFMLQVGLLSTLQVREHEGRGGYIQSIGIDQRYDDVFGPVESVTHASSVGPSTPTPTLKPIQPPVSRSSSPTPGASGSASSHGSNGHLDLPAEGSSRRPRGPRESTSRHLPRTPSVSSVRSVASNLPEAQAAGEEGQFDDPDSPSPQAAPPIYTGNSEEYDAVVDLVNRKRLPPSDLPTRYANANLETIVPLSEAVEVVRRATRHAKGRRGAPMSASRKKTIMESAKPLELPEQGFLLDPRETEALLQYDSLITRELLDRLESRRTTFQTRDEWQKMHVKVTDAEFEQALRKMHPALKKLIFLSEPWPTGKMNPVGWEVDPKIYRQPGIAPPPRVAVTSPPLRG